MQQVETSWKWLFFTSALGVVAACLWTLTSACSIFVIWQSEICSQNTKWSRATYSIIVGTELVVVAMVASFVARLPTMIMTWTTAFVLSIPGYFITAWRRKERRSLVTDGKKLAREISLQSMQTSFSQAKLVALGVIVACLVSYLVVREAYDDD